MEVVPDRLITLSQTCLGASEDVADAQTEAAGAVRVDDRAAGNTSAGPAFVGAHTAAAEAADVALGRLVATLESDMDALQLCAFEFAETDEAQATTLESHRLLLPGLTVA